MWYVTTIKRSEHDYRRVMCSHAFRPGGKVIRHHIWMSKHHAKSVAALQLGCSEIVRKVDDAPDSALPMINHPFAGRREWGNI